MLEESIMETRYFLLMVLFSTMLLAAQNASKADKPNDLHHPDIVITGCLSKNSLNEFELLDEGGIDNLPYSSVVDLDEYVGKTVTLSGRRAATQHDTGREKPHFQVSKVRLVSDQCKRK
jgi:hypothetical protein